MIRWVRGMKHLLMLSILMGMAVGLAVNLAILSSPINLKVSEAVKVEGETDQKSTEYWRGRVDSKLDTIDQRMNEFALQIEKLNCNLTEVKVAAARDGGIYGAITSLIVLLASMLGRYVLKERNRPPKGGHSRRAQEPHDSGQRAG